MARGEAQQQLDELVIEALRRGHTLRVNYADGMTHRLRFGQSQPPAPIVTRRDAIREMVRQPYDLDVVRDAIAAEKLLNSIAIRHGRWEVE
jgi:hypothetical protein